MAANLLPATSGTIRLLGRAPQDPETCRRVAFVAQEKPLYPHFSVADTLRIGRELNSCRDQQAAERLVREGAIDLGQRVGRLSGGQRIRVTAEGQRYELPGGNCLVQCAAGVETPIAPRVCAPNRSISVSRSSGTPSSRSISTELEGTLKV